MLYGARRDEAAANLSKNEKAGGKRLRTIACLIKVA